MCIALILMGASAAFADKVILKDGRTFEGLVIENDETQVRIKMAKGVVSFPREQVESVELLDKALHQREEKFEALDPEKPAGYLATAEWLTSEGKDGCDLATLQRLVSAAVKLDPSLAYRAQMLLGARLETESRKRDAATAYARALRAKAGDAEATSRIERLRPLLQGSAKDELALLGACLQLILDGKYAEALPLLAKCERQAMTEAASRVLGVTFEALHEDISSRVRCSLCEGKGSRTCPACEGQGATTCAKCKGTGLAKNLEGNEGEVGIADKICRTCWGLRTILCRKCEAERDVTISYAMVRGRRREDSKVHAKAGAEEAALSKFIDLGKLEFRKSHEPVWGIGAGDPSPGGRIRCDACGGREFNPPSAPPDVDRIRRYLVEVRDCESGRTNYDAIPVVTDLFDPSPIADGKLRYRGGEWVK